MNDKERLQTKMNKNVTDALMTESNIVITKLKDGTETSVEYPAMSILNLASCMELAGMNPDFTDGELKEGVSTVKHRYLIYAVIAQIVKQKLFDDVEKLCNVKISRKVESKSKKSRTTLNPKQMVQRIKELQSLKLK